MKKSFLKLIITIIVISLFCYVSKLYYMPELHGPIILMWLGVAISLLQMWRYQIRWPRGRYNGRKIDGFSVQFDLHLLWWRFKPIFSWSGGMPYITWLCFSLRGEASYKIK